MSEIFTHKGIIIKSVGGFYSVETPSGVLVCKARGIFRKNNLSPVAGDRVVVVIEDKNEPVITEVEQRKNLLIRPPLANLDCILLIVSACEPVPNGFVLDKLISIFENKEIEPIIVFTKTDLRDCDDFAEIYKKIGIQSFVVNNMTSEGIELVKDVIKGKISAVIGNSGVGKSSLMNLIFPQLNADTGIISKKLGRGKHTTRQVELFKLDDGGYIADTPGFSTVEANRYGYIPKEEIMYTFREFKPLFDKCKFKDCMHLKEKECAVTQAVNSGVISKSRYDSYVRMYEEASKLNDWEQKG